jgi:hypothetical protein
MAMIVIDMVLPLFITHYYGYYTRPSWHPSSDPPRPVMKSRFTRGSSRGCRARTSALIPGQLTYHLLVTSCKANPSKATVISMIHRIGGYVRLCLALPISRRVRRGWILTICLVNASLVPGSLITILRGVEIGGEPVGLLSSFNILK